MKCLDEGVDIPKTRAAIFCSSSGNSRQFIQRRGRILRKATGKNYAYIYDLVVVPPRYRGVDDIKSDQTILKSELQRVIEFSDMAINKYESLQKLEEICNNYGLDIYGL